MTTFDPNYSLFTEDLDHVLDRTRADWQQLRDGRLFITGGTGFFGMWLVETFLWANQQLDLHAEATVLTRDPDAFARKAPNVASQPAIRLHAGDVRKFDFPIGEYTHVIHAATEASASLNEQLPAYMFESIVNGTHRTLDFAVACGARKFLLASSGAVYGKQPHEITHVGEDYNGAPDPQSPASAYGEGKRVAEMLCGIYARAHGIDATIARCFAFVGPYLPLDIHFAVGNFLRDVLQNKAIQVRGDGAPLRSYLYTSDLAVWLWTILFRGQSCRPYNVGSDEAISIRELAYCVAQTADIDNEVCVASPPNPAAPRVQYVPSVERSKSELGLKVDVPLATALRRTLAWHQASQLVTTPAR
jgi:dTDP-glucose 4,6-dehydratase